MRQVQIVVPDQRVEEFLELVQDYDDSPQHLTATGPFDTMILNVDDSRVDELVEILRVKGLDEEGQIIILPPSVAFSHSSKKQRFPYKKQDEKVAPSVELMELAKGSSELGKSFVFMTVISAFVATLGLLLDSTAVVIGAMVIAPLLGPSIAICVGTVLGEPKLFRDSLVNLIIGLLVSRPRRIQSLVHYLSPARTSCRLPALHGIERLLPLLAERKSTRTGRILVPSIHRMVG